MDLLGVRYCSGVSHKHLTLNSCPGQPSIHQPLFYFSVPWLPHLIPTERAAEGQGDPFPEKQTAWKEQHPRPLSPLLHTHHPAPSAKRASPPEQPHLAPPSPAPSLATGKSMGVSQAQGSGQTGLNKLREGNKPARARGRAHLFQVPKAPTGTKGGQAQEAAPATEAGGPTDW